MQKSQNWPTYKFDSFQLTWSEAREFCEKERKKLAELKTEAQRDYVLEMLNSGYPFAGVVPFETLWIGGKKSARSDRWIWPKSKEEIILDFPWVPNKSINKLGEKYCLNLMKYTDGNGTKFGFSDNLCNIQRDNFLCESGYSFGSVSSNYRKVEDQDNQKIENKNKNQTADYYAYDNIIYYDDADEFPSSINSK